MMWAGLGSNCEHEESMGILKVPRAFARSMRGISPEAKPASQNSGHEEVREEQQNGYRDEEH